MPAQMLTVVEVAGLLRVRVEYVRFLCRSGQLVGAFKVGRGLRIPASSVDRYVATRPKAAA